jgi:diaminopimelate decarboxylase
MFRNRELAEIFGTPLYVYDLDRVAASYRDLHEALPPEFVIFYSLKANPHPDVASALGVFEGRRACRAEVGSVTELAVALEAGFKASECLYLGPDETESDLVIAVSRGVQTFSVESLSDLERVGSAARRVGTVIDCLLRINTAGSGTIWEQLPMLRSVAGVRLAGAHFSSLGNARDEQSLIGELTQTVRTAARLFAEFCLPMRLLNIGGGFWTPYAVPGNRPVYPNLRVELERALDAHFPCWRLGTPRIACESGCYLVGDCGELISTVTNIRESHGGQFVILDAGMDPVGRMPGLGHPMPLEVGDVITVPNVGAYGATANLLLFLSRPAPREVVVQGGKIVTVSQLRVRRDVAGTEAFE